MATSLPRKVGRKQRHHVDSKTGLPVVGLSRRPSDGRWRVIGTQITFTEPDEQRAIQRFQELKGSSPEQQSFQRAVDNQQMGLSGPALWRYVAQQIDERPQWVAKQTGKEWIAYGAELKPPEPLPSWAELETEFKTHFHGTPEEKRKVLAAWKDFTTTAKAVGLRDVTAQVALAYRDIVHGRSWGGKMQAHTFNRIRRFLRFYSQERGKCIEPIAKVLNVLAVLKPNESTVTIDPKPIEPSDFRAMLSVAEGDDKALLLLMLNCALYQQEAVNLEWDDIKQGKFLVAHRAKNGKCVRVAVLWQETIEALSTVARKGANIFYNREGLPLEGEGARRRLEKLRDKAAEKYEQPRLKEVTSSMLRDGACTAAAAANVNEQIW